MIELIEDQPKSLLSVGRKLEENFLHNLAPFFAKGIAGAFNRIAVLPQRGMHAVLQLRSLPAQYHAGARQLARIAHRRRRDPNRRQGPGPLQAVHPFRIKLVTLIDAAHHQFRQPRVDQLWHSSSSLDLINHPVPVSHGLHRHGRSFTPSMNKVLNRPMRVCQPTLVQSFSLRILDPCPGILLVNVQCDVFHNCSPPRPIMLIIAVTESIAFIIIRMTLRHNLLGEGSGFTYPPSTLRVLYSFVIYARGL